MTSEQPCQSKIGKRGSINTIDGGRRRFSVVDEIIREQPVPEKHTKKCIHFQQLRFDDEEQVQYRFTYYMIGVKSGARGRWVFGQSSLLIPAEYLQLILEEARRRGWDGV